MTADDVKVIPFPSYTESENEPGTILSGFSSGWYISKKCWNDEAKRKAAIDFVKYNSSDEAIVKFVEAGGGFAASDTAKMDESKMTAQQKQFLQLLKDAPATPMVAQDNLERPAFEVYLANATKLAKGETTPEAVLKELADLCDGPITDEELEDCRRGLLAGMNGLEDTLGGIETWYYMEVLRGGPVQTPDDARRALLAVTREDVRDILRQFTLSVSCLLTREEGNENG